MKTWTQEEEAILRDRAADGIDVLAALLPTKTRTSIYTRASKEQIAIARVLDYDRDGDELTNKTWAWENRIKPKLTTNGECKEWGGSHSKGYGQIRIFVRGEKRIFSTHRIAWEVANGRLMEATLSGCHTCDNPRCNNPVHIFPGTHRDNVADMHAKGRQRGQFKPGRIPHKNMARGERSGNAVLSDEKVTWARVIHAAGLIGYKLLGKRLGVAPQGLRSAILKERWKHVPEPTQEKREEILREYLSVNPAKPKRTGKSVSIT